MSDRYRVETLISSFLVGCMLGNNGYLFVGTWLTSIMAILLSLLSLLFSVGWGVVFGFLSYSKFVICILLISFGFFWSIFFNLHFPGSELRLSQNTEIYQGKVVDNPYIKNNKLVFSLSIDKIVLQNSETVSSIAQVYTDAQSNIRYGDRLKVRAILEKPKNFIADNGQEFDYVSYLKARHVSFIIRSPEILEHKVYTSLKASLYYFRNCFIKNLEISLPEPESSLASGILLGDRGGLGKDLEDKFRKTGLSHIVVLSGFNITIISLLITKMFSAFPKRWRFVLAIISLILFCMMVGWTATVIRSFIMASIMCCADLFKKEYDMWRSLFLSALFMCLFNPFLISFDPSFELSFLATISLAGFSPLFSKLFNKITERFLIRETLINTFSAQILTVPYILKMTGSFSLISPLSNIIILPAIPYAMFLSFLSGILGFFSNGISRIFSSITYVILHYVIFIVEYLANLNFSYINLF